MNDTDGSARILLLSYLETLNNRHTRLSRVGFSRIFSAFHNDCPEKRYLHASRMGRMVAALSLLVVDIVILSDIVGRPISKLFRATRNNHPEITLLTPRRKKELIRRIFNAAQQCTEE